MPQSPILLSTGQTALPGIIGGLGPLAHIEFERRLLAESMGRGAAKDQQHPVWLLLNAAATPDRTQSLEGLVADCVPWLLNYAQQLERMGANFLVVTCNTAHAFHAAVQAQLGIPWLHMMTLVCGAIALKYPSARRIGVMATSGTLRAHLYSQSLSALGLTPVFPAVDSWVQQQVMESIYAPIGGIKASGDQVSSFAVKKLRAVMHWFEQAHTDLVIAGCTELSVGLSCLSPPGLAPPGLAPPGLSTSGLSTSGLSTSDSVPDASAPGLPWIDPLSVLANATLDLAMGVATLDKPDSTLLHRAWAS